MCGEAGAGDGSDPAEWTLSISLESDSSADWLAVVVVSDLFTLRTQCPTPLRDKKRLLSPSVHPGRATGPVGSLRRPRWRPPRDDLQGDRGRHRHAAATQADNEDSDVHGSCCRGSFSRAAGESRYRAFLLSLLVSLLIGNECSFRVVC